MVFKYLIVSLQLLNCLSLRQLAFSGGGAFGAVEIGIISKIRTFDKDPFDFYTGISAGGINAGYFSHYTNIDDAILNSKQFYSNLKNSDVYSILPRTNNSLLNTEPLENTIYNILSNSPSSSIETYIGTTNLYSGSVDIYRYDQFDNINDHTNLLLATSAIPVVFPPIIFNNIQYADGGTLENELLGIKHDNSYLNITFITPYSDDLYDNSFLNNVEQVALRTIKVVTSNFNNEFTKINSNCQNPIGEINKFFISTNLTNDYSMLNFNHGSELINLGFNNMEKVKIYIC
jgi:predicted patatin/cPLA2 family phospholipase